MNIEIYCTDSQESIKFEIFTFSAGEVQVRFISLPPFLKSVTIKAHLRNSSDIIALLQIGEFFAREKIEIFRLYLPYFPFSRMDRAIEFYSFSLISFASIINALNSKHVETLDIHSSAPSLMIKNFKNIDPYYMHIGFLNTFHQNNSLIINDLTMVIPDAGASKRYELTQAKFSHKVQALKHRNAEGEITHTYVYGDVKDRDCVIFDDICDGGRTFIEIARQLKANGAQKLYLFVTHGIFSQGLEQLFNYFDLIGCSDSFGDKEWAVHTLEKLKVIK